MSEEGVPLQQVIASHRAGHLQEAEAGYSAWLSAHPDDPDALHFLGLLRMHQGRPEEAIELVRRSISVLPDNPHAWNNLGNLFLKADREDEAITAYERAAVLAPDMLEAIHNLGVVLRKRRRAEEAIAVFSRVIAANPRFAPAWENLAAILYRLGRPDDAAAAYRNWFEADPENPVARHMVAATSGDAMLDRAPTDYLATTFDGFADSFDASLQRLGYVAPQLLASILGEHVNVGRGNLDTLDAGCGTGLCGVLLRSTARTLVGVDLSRGMLEKARQRGIYDELVQGELCEFMRARPAAFDVIVSGDTLIYFGALDAPLDAARAALKPGGVFAFTVEAAPPDSRDGFILEAHGRFTHTRDYLESRLLNAGFETPHIEQAVLRKELDLEVAGFAVVAHAARRDGSTHRADAHPSQR